jgi:hypothetical protein
MERWWVLLAAHIEMLMTLRHLWATDHHPRLPFVSTSHLYSKEQHATLIIIPVEMLKCARRLLHPPDNHSAAIVFLPQWLQGCGERHRGGNLCKLGVSRHRRRANSMTSKGQSRATNNLTALRGIWTVNWITETMLFEPVTARDGARSEVAMLRRKIHMVVALAYKQA